MDYNSTDGLKLFILKWLHARKDNLLISKSMMPKLKEFQQFDRADIMQAIETLDRNGHVNVKKVSTGPRAIELLSIAQLGEKFLFQNFVV